MSIETCSKTEGCRRGIFGRRVLPLFLMALGVAVQCKGALKPADFTDHSPGVSFAKDRIERVPWAIDVVRVDRSRSDLNFRPMLGLGNHIGLNRLSSQVRMVPAGAGRPIAAINGDFYKTENEPFPGDPRGMFISGGEIVSAPNGGAVFWFEADGTPRIGPVESAFEVVWPDKQSSTLGFNELNEEVPAILFTAASSLPPLGRRGRFLLLEASSTNAWVPFGIGQRISAQVAGETHPGRPIEPAKPWLWVASEVRSARDLKPGATIQLNFLSTPSIKDVSTAIGGGPVLVRAGAAQRPTTNKAGERHPRSALGWNESHYFLVTVDGRQPGHSVGMTLPELAVYMKELGCMEAMNLDGGGSTELWMDGRILNTPCYGHERETATSLVVVRKEENKTRGGPVPARSVETKSNRN